MYAVEIWCTLSKKISSNLTKTDNIRSIDPQWKKRIQRSLFGFIGLREMGERDLDRDFFLLGEGVLEPYFLYVSGLFLRIKHFHFWWDLILKILKNKKCQSLAYTSRALALTLTPGQLDFDAFSSADFLSL